MCSRNDCNHEFNHRVLNLFQQLNRIPRESGKEQAVSDWIRAWAEERGLEAEQDDIWNLIIRKPAFAGYEDHPPIMLQAHMDMVCEKDSNSTHDFAKDPIGLKMDGEWIVSANGTTLGADDGIGIAAAMAVLEDTSLPAPPLEVVFTVQEETTFAGAERVDISGCRAMRMINLDHADERELIVGSCGGTGVRFTMPLQREPRIPEGMKGFRIHLTGLMGGHSGEDIHRGRGNAISLLLRLLEDPRLRTVAITGGTNRLAIPREAEALVLAESEQAARESIQSALAVFRREYGAAPDLDITMDGISTDGAVSADAKAGAPLAADAKAGVPLTADAKAGAPLTAASFDRLAAVLRLYPNGIVQMNGSLEGLVESSDNIGVISTDDDTLTLTSEVRGAYQSTVQDITKTIESLAALVGAQVSYFNGYVPWEFTADSPLRTIATETFARMHPGSQMKEIALHAGLECGFFAEKKPGMDLISIGPDCQYFHSPKERVNAASVVRFYDYLTAILRKC